MIVKKYFRGEPAGFELDRAAATKMQFVQQHTQYPLPTMNKARVTTPAHTE